MDLQPYQNHALKRTPSLKLRTMLVSVGLHASLFGAGIALVLGAVIGIRVWWFNRKLRRQAGAQPPPRRAEPGGVIEGEYHVVKGDKKP